VEVPHGQSPQLWNLLQLQVARQNAAAPASQPIRVLDCGGGSGSLAVPIALLGAEVTVVDASIDALSTLVRRATEAGIPNRISAVQGDAEALAELVPSAHFALVLAHDVLGSVSNPGAALAALAAAVAPGGSLSVVLRNSVAHVLSRALVGDLASALDTARRSPQDEYRVADVERSCLDAGLVLDSVIGLGVFEGLISGLDSEAIGFAAGLAELEALTCTESPYRDIAARIHLLAHRP
jgi:S-adenosylmethionine-dependent methyltransferase